jgi:hypothetical protein
VILHGATSQTTLIFSDWVRDLAFLVDLTANLNELNLKQQGEHQFSLAKTSQAKLCLWKTQLKSCNTLHFATLSDHVTHDYSSFANELCLLNNHFNERFQEFKSQERSYASSRPPLISKLTMCHRSSRCNCLKCKEMTC